MKINARWASAYAAVLLLAAAVAAAEPQEADAYFQSGGDTKLKVPNKASVSLNYPVQGDRLVATVTLDAAAAVEMKFVAEVRECVVLGTFKSYQTGERWQKNVCSESNSTRHASLQAYHNGTGSPGADPPATGYSDIEMFPYYDQSIRNGIGGAQKTGKYWVATYKTITIPAGDESGTAEWATRANGDTDAESILVMVHPMGPGEYKFHGENGTAKWHDGDDPQYAGEYGGRHFWQTKIAGDLPVAYIRASSFHPVIEEGRLVAGTITFSHVAPHTFLLAASWDEDGDFLPGWQRGERSYSVAAGNPSRSVTATTIDDSVDEPDGSVTVTLLQRSGYVVGYPSSVTVQILDNDDPVGSFSPPPVPAVSIGLAGGGAEGDPVSFGIGATPAPRSPLPVNVTLSGAGNVLNASDAGWRIVEIPPIGSYTLEVPTIDDGVTDVNNVTLTINPGAGYTPGQFASWTVDVQDAGASQELVQPPVYDKLTRAQDLTAVAIDPALIANVTAMANQTQHGDAHVERWNRVLAAFGETAHDSPTTAAEARDNAEKYSSPLWPLIADVLALLEAAAAEQDGPQTPPDVPTEPDAPPAIDPALVAKVRAQASQVQHGDAHVDRWNRVLAAFGETAHDSPTTAAEARDNAEKYSSPLWPLIADVLALLEAAAAEQDGPQTPPDVPTEPDAPPAIDPALVAKVRAQASQVQHGDAHVDRWNRVLAAFGEIDRPNPTTAAEARANSEKYSSPLWPLIADVLAARE